MVKFLKKILLILLVLFVLLIGYLFIGKAKPAEKIEWGATFSKRTANDYGLDWQKTFLDVLDDLKVKKIRLIAYWDEVEKTEGKFDFQDLDWQVDKVSKRGAEIILAVGRRLPRWPECFEPDWAKNLIQEEKQEKILDYIKETINHYKDNKNIIIWQIENEPFLRTFGECPWPDKKFLDREIALAKYLDPSTSSGQGRPIMITESGEFSTWIGGAKRADILGTSVYRKVYGKLGYVKYPIPAVFYQRKSNLIKLLFDIEEIIAIEVQAEPWGQKPSKEMTLQEQDISLGLKQFEEMIEYTKNTGFDKAYLWGVEWWYWKKINGDDRFWQKAKELF